MNSKTDEVFRDKISERRDGYFVDYFPAVAGMNFASLSLVFTSDYIDSENVKKLMDDELTHWLERFQVALHVSSFDAKGDLMQDETYPHLIGYMGEAVSRRILPPDFSSARMGVEGHEGQSA